MVSQHFSQFGAHRASASGDIMYLIYYVISKDHLIRWSRDFMSESPSR